MGGACSNGLLRDKDGEARNDQVEKSLAEWNKDYMSEKRLLLLGPGESGKSTIFKQMKIISKSRGYTREELQSWRLVIFGNCISQMQILCDYALANNFPFQMEENISKSIELVETPSGGSSWSPRIAEMIACLWEDAGIQQVYLRRDREFQLNDSSSYFFSHARRLGLPDYIPVTSDVVRARVRSTGIQEAVFNFEDISFRLVDVGGQRAERRKWIHCFSDVTAMIFCASLSEYDQRLREDVSINRMDDSLGLFEDVCNSPWFREKPVVLFLNKTDLFREKLLRVPLSSTFPAYQGRSFEDGCSFILQLYMSKNTSPHRIYSHFTCAISTENIEIVFRTVRQTLLQDVFSKSFLT